MPRSSLGGLPFAPLLLLAACGGGGGGAAPIPAPPSGGMPSPTPSPTPTPAPPPSITAAADTIEIDVSRSTSGTINLFANDSGSALSLSELSYDASVLGTISGGQAGVSPNFSVPTGLGRLRGTASGEVTFTPDRFDTSTASRFLPVSVDQIGQGQSLTETVTYRVSGGGATATGTIAVTLRRPAGDTVTGTGNADTLVPTRPLFDTVIDGGAGDDTLIGGFGNDTLLGGAGNDVLRAVAEGADGSVGRVGRDHFNGGAGDDRIFGGSGLTDVAVFGGLRSEYRITGTPDQLSVTDLNPSNGDDGTDTLSSIEILQFADGLSSTYADRSTLPSVVINADINDALIVSGTTVVLTDLFDNSPAQFFLTLPGAAVRLIDVTGAALPAWLSFDPATYRVTAAPPAGFEGTLALAIEWSRGGSSERDPFTLFVAAPAPSDIRGTTTGETLNGTAGSDRIYGEGGPDVLRGSPGGDLLVGDPRRLSILARADYSASPAAIDLDFDFGRFRGGDAEGDILINIGEVTGSGFADRIISTQRFDRRVIDGGAGDDMIVASGGRVIGGAGADLIRFFTAGTVDYSTSPAGVIVDLVAGTGSGSDAEGDRLFGAAMLIGSAFDDVIKAGRQTTLIESGAGNDRLEAAAGPPIAGMTAEGDSGGIALNAGAGDDTLFGGDGADQLFGGPGADSFDGRGGRDTVVYIGGTFSNLLGDTFNASSRSVTVNLGTGVGTGNDAQGDTYTSIENVRGTISDDVLIGSDGSNQLFGEGGRDRLEGGAGDDALILKLTLPPGGLMGAVPPGPAPVADGGAGRDMLVLENASLLDLRSGRVDSPSGLSPSLAGIEDVGTFQSMVVLGDDGANRFNPTLAVGNLTLGASDDNFVGRGGDDQLFGRFGRDVLIEATDRATLDGGEGADILVAVAATNLELVRMTGGAGDDLFILATERSNQTSGTFNFAWVEISDFNRGQGDRIDLSDLRDAGGQPLDLADILPRATTSGADLVIDLSGFTSGGRGLAGALVLLGAAAGGQPQAGDFMFDAGANWAAAIPADLPLH